MSNLIKITILASLLLNGFLKAQTPTVRFQHIGLEEGLSQNAVMDITKDSTGFLWIATRDGLNRYNGYEIKVYRNDYEDSTSINSNIVRKLFIDSKNRLWIATENGGLSQYRSTTDDFSNPLSQINDKHFTVSSNIIEDSLGMLWFCVDKVGLVKYNIQKNDYEVFELLNDKQKKLFYHLSQVEDEFWITTYEDGLIMFDIEKEVVSRRSAVNKHNLTIPNETGSIHNDTDGNIYVSTLHGIYKYKKEIADFELLNIPEFNPINSDISAIQVEDSILWFVSKNRGLYKYNLRNDFLSFYTSDAKSRYALSHPFVTCLFQDKQNNLWAGTYGGGVNKIDLDVPFNLYIHDPNDSFSLANSSSRKILKDKYGRLIVSSYEGIRVFNNETKKSFDLPYVFGNNDFKNKRYSKLIASVATRTMVWENDKELWIGYEGAGIQRYNFETEIFENFNLVSENSTHYKSNVISTMVKDQKGVVWAATHDGLWYKDSLSDSFNIYSLNKIQEPEVFSIHVPKSGHLFATSQDGLHFINGANKQLINCKNIPEHLNKNKCLINSRMTFITSIDDSTLLIGSKGNGLIKFKYKLIDDHLKIKEFKIVDNDFIKEQTVYAILKQNDSIVWFSSNDGLFKYNFITNEVFNYTFMDGLQGNEFNYESYYQDKDGSMYFGGISGINKFKPEEVKLEKQEVKLYFNSIEFGDSTISNIYAKDSLSNIIIPYNNNNVTVKYLGINLNRPNNTNYFVQLLGVDSEPVAMGKQRELNFFSLKPGHYELRVWATNLNKIKSNNKNFKTLNFFISPPFYLSLWFKILVLAIIASLIMTAIKLRMRGLLKDKERLEKEIQLSQKEIHNQKLESEIATSRAVIRGQNLEQKRISEELHDGIGHLLTAASLNISAIKNYIKKGLWEKLPDEVENVSEILNQSITEVRNVSHNLMPNLLIEEGLESAISEFVRRIQRSSNIDIEFKSKNLSEDIPMETAVSIFRMIQEAVNNSLRHAQADSIFIGINQISNNILITVNDNGIGFEKSNMKSSTGQGLKNLYARAELNRGSFEIVSNPNKGTEISITIPIF